MTFIELMDIVGKYFPGAEVLEDNDGQLVIYTNLEEKPNGNLEEFVMPEG